MQIVHRIFIITLSLSTYSIMQAAKPSSQSYMPILEWAKIGRLDKIKQYEELNKKKEGAIDWNARNSARQTPLILAAQNNHINVVEYLLSKNADRSIKDSVNKTAEDYARENGHSIVLSKLLNTPDAYTGETLLTQAIKVNDISTVKDLIERGITVHEPRKDGLKPLMFAIKLYPTTNEKNKQEALAIINALIEKGAVTDLPETKTKKTILHYAIEVGLPKETIEKIIPHTKNLEGQDEEGDTPLHYASQYTNSDVVDKLYQESAKILAVNKKGKTPRDIVGAKTKTNRLNQVTAIQNTLDFYAKNPHATPRQTTNNKTEETNKKLKSATSTSASTANAAGGVQVHTTNEQQKTNMAKDRKELERAALQQSNEIGQTLLTQAVAEGNLENVTKLLAMDAMVNAYDANGDTPLLTAVKNYSLQPKYDLQRYLDIVDILLNNKASLLLFDTTTHKSPLHIAIENEEQPLVERLLKALNSNNNDDAINAQDLNGDTPLHYAAAAANPALIKALLDSGADKNISNKSGKKTLDIMGTKDSVAVMHSNKTATQKLIDAEDNKKKTKELLSDEWDESRPTRGRTQSVFQAPKPAK